MSNMSSFCRKNIYSKSKLFHSCNGIFLVVDSTTVRMYMLYFTYPHKKKNVWHDIW